MGEDVSAPKCVTDLETNGNFHRFQSVEKCRPKFPVEVVDCAHVAQSGPGFKLGVDFDVSLSVLAPPAEWKPVTREPVVTDPLKERFCLAVIADVHASFNEEGDLLAN